VKLIYCPHCHDIISLGKESKSCKCKKSGGKYKNKINAVYWGKAVPLVIDNEDFKRALKYIEQIKGDKGHVFDTFVIKSDCKTFVKGKKK